MTEEQTPRPSEPSVFQDIEVSAPAALDSLLSPTSSEPAHYAVDGSLADSDPNSRDSLVTSDDGEQVLGTDLRFSTIPLSAHPSTATLDDNDSDDASSLHGIPPASPKASRRATIQLGSASTRSSTLAGESMHKRSTSGSSAGSLKGLPFMLQRLDLQKMQQEPAPTSSARSSRQILEEFNRIHEQDVQAENASHAAIDWGTAPCFVFYLRACSYLSCADFWGSVISGEQHCFRQVARVRVH
jgi:hypothetical protein